MLALRAVVAFLALPGMVAFVVPFLLTSFGDARSDFQPLSLPVFAAGVFLVAAATIGDRRPIPIHA